MLLGMSASDPKRTFLGYAVKLGQHVPPLGNRMPQAVIHISLGPGNDATAMETFNKEWQLVEDWMERWRDRGSLFPDNPQGCLCCHAYWEVEASQTALDELPARMLQPGSW